MSGRRLPTREDELEQVLTGGHEAAAAVERRRPPVAAGHDDLEPRRSLGDRVALCKLEQLLADALGLMLGAHEELVHPHGLGDSLERDVAGRRPCDLRHEDRLALEHGERALVGAAVHAGEAEEERLVLPAERSDLGLAIGHATTPSPSGPWPGRPPPAPPARAPREP